MFGSAGQQSLQVAKHAALRAVGEHRFRFRQGLDQQLRRVGARDALGDDDMHVEHRAQERVQILFLKKGRINFEEGIDVVFADGQPDIVLCFAGQGGNLRDKSFRFGVIDILGRREQSVGLPADLFHRLFSHFIAPDIPGSLNPGGDNRSFHLHSSLPSII